MNGRSSKAAGVTKSRLKRVESDTNGRMQNARYGVDGLHTKKQDATGSSSREYGAGISTSASTPLTQNSTAPSITYISGPVILGAEINGEFVYHLGDALSTVRDVVDDQGDVIRSFEFDEYGNMLSSSGSGAASPKTWIGGLSVNDDRADSGLWNMGHRNYAGGVLGRFINRDPIGHAGGLNLYAYPANPVNAVDPEGLDPSGGVWTEEEINYYRKIGEEALERAAYEEWLAKQPHTCTNFRIGEHLDPGYGIDMTDEFLGFFFGSKLLEPLRFVKIKPAGPKITLKGKRTGGGYSVRIEGGCDGVITSIEKERVRKIAPVPGKPGVMNNVKFKDPLPGSKGKKRAPTPAEQYIFQVMTAPRNL